MVDFKKYIGEKKRVLPTDPFSIFSNLDKKSGKEYLWPSQKQVLDEWNKKARNQKDVIVKLPTGQGKTLIGLLILQSFLNEGNGPAIYLCPNKYLVSQVKEQAGSFGVKVVTYSEEDHQIPLEFRNSESILIATCKKLFNAKTKFGIQGINDDYIPIGAIVIDDVHTCLDIIRQSFTLIIEKSSPLYNELYQIFSSCLEKQKPGTKIAIDEGENQYITVPFWNWFEREKKVVEIINKFKDRDEVQFVWDLIKNDIHYCICIISGRKIEIQPRIIPINKVLSFSRAKNRIYLTATLNEDAFLVKDFDIDPEIIKHPLTFPDMKYSGERCILIPSLVDVKFTREFLIKAISNFYTKPLGYGIFVLAPSKAISKDWQTKTKIIDVSKIYEELKELNRKIEQKQVDNIIVLMNQYDGIDLPGDTCRILCLDSLPTYSPLMDRYMQDLMPDSDYLKRKMAQRIEQGMGRGIRGSGDWCVVIIMGNSLVNLMAVKSQRQYFSKEVQKQIQIAESLVEILKKEYKGWESIEKVIEQCIQRDEGWKAYYKDSMESIEPEIPRKDFLERVCVEREAEMLYQSGQTSKAISLIQAFINENKLNTLEKGWFLELIAMYKYDFDKSGSLEVHLSAFSNNKSLPRPDAGIQYEKITSKSTDRERIIIAQLKFFEKPNAAIIGINEILEKLTFNSGQTATDLFEEGIDQLGELLGFKTQRPEKEYGSGPDNLWKISSDVFWIIECKSGVGSDRGISKDECGQMSNSIAWFKEKYPQNRGIPVFIHPSSELDEKANISDTVFSLVPDRLDLLKKAINDFYATLMTKINTISEPEVTSLFPKYNFGDSDNLQRKYLLPVRRG
nr:DEAD/DEAH box helicase family protein [Candidatus Sigynarchaeota archaeon]